MQINILAEHAAHISKKPNETGHNSHNPNQCVAVNSKRAHQPRPRPHVRVPFFSKQGRMPAARAIPRSGLSPQSAVRCEPNHRAQSCRMSALATVPTADEAIPVKEPRITPKLRKALHLLETGECSTQRAAAERAGMSEYQLSRRLREPQIQVFIARKRAENISVGSLRASRRFVQLIDAGSEHVSAQVSERILRSEGVLKSDSHQVSVNIDIKAGYVIDLTDSPKAVTDARLTHAIEHDANE